MTGNKALLPYTQQDGQQVPARMVRSWEQDPQELYVNPLSPDGRSIIGNADSPIIATGIVSVLAAVIGFGAAGALNAWPVMEWLGLATAGAIVPTLVAVPNYRHRARLKDVLYQNIKGNLSAWVNQRYGLNTTAETFTYSHVYLVNGIYEDDSTKAFEADGREFLLVSKQHMFYVEEKAKRRPLPPPPEAKLATVAHIPKPTAAELPGEAGMLAQKINTTLELLRRNDITAAGRQLADRAEGELAQTMKMYDKLLRLGGVSQSDMAAIIESLSGLGAELNSLLTEVRAVVSRELAVQVRYIKNRVGNQNPILTLDAAGQQALNEQTQALHSDDRSATLNT